MKWIDTTGLDGLAFTVLGEPVSQGSMKVNRRTGSLYHVKNDALVLWRHRILQEAFLEAHAHRWILPKDGTGLDEPVLLSARFYLKKPLRPRFLYPAVKPDQDKLLRAVQDALAPRKGRRFLFDDSRVIGSRVQKDYAASRRIGDKDGPRLECAVYRFPGRGNGGF